MIRRTKKALLQRLGWEYVGVIDNNTDEEKTRMGDRSTGVLLAACFVLLLLECCRQRVLGSEFSL